MNPFFDHVVQSLTSSLQPYTTLHRQFTTKAVGYSNNRVRLQLGNHIRLSCRLYQWQNQSFVKVCIFCDDRKTIIKVTPKRILKRIDSILAFIKPFLLQIEEVELKEHETATLRKALIGEIELLTDLKQIYSPLRPRDVEFANGSQTIRLNVNPETKRATSISLQIDLPWIEVLPLLGYAKKSLAEV